MSQTGRNAPCPCGSGKKFKKCCLAKGETSSNAPQDNVIPGFRETFQDREFSSLEEAQNFANAFMQNRNNLPLDEFHDVSPEQMMRMQHFPYESPEVVEFFEPKSDVSQVPVMRLLNLLLNGIGESGVKATAKGNLPRNLCREIAQNYWTADELKQRTRYANINTELDFYHLHIIRSFERFVLLFGLVEMDEENKHKVYRMNEDYQIRKLPLLDETVRFHIRTVH